MKVLVACEFSGVIREAFLARGHDTYSCDLLPARVNPAAPGRHLQQDVTPLLQQSWDLVIAHPPCTYLCRTGLRWFKTDPVGRRLKLLEAIEFFRACYHANAPRVCVENPVMAWPALRAIGCGEPSQKIDPSMFGHNETKMTCLWLRGLPLLEPTKVIDKRRCYARTHQAWQRRGSLQGLIRSVTYQGIAEAMAEQWGKA